MFSMYFGSSLASPLYRRAAAAAATGCPPFPQVIFLKLSTLSTSTSVKNRSVGYREQENTGVVSDYLLSECGLCQSELSTVLKRRPSLVRTKSTHTAQQAVLFLRDLGCTEQQVKKVITRNPYFLAINAEKQLKPKLEFMKTLGLTTEDVRNAICICSRIFGGSLEKTLCPNILYLQTLFGSEVDISRLFKVANWILYKRNGPEIFERRLKHMTSFGLPDDKIKELVRRFPFVVSYSSAKVQKTMDYLIHTAGLSANFVITYPKILTYSLERRIKPRHKVLKSLSAMQPSEPLPTLYSVVPLTEQSFLEKYVKCSPHSTELLEIYSGKPVDLDTIR